MNTLLRLLLAFFVLRVEGDPDPQDPPPQDPPADPNQNLELDLGGDDPDPAPAGDPPPEDPKVQLATERAAREAAERRATEATERYEREVVAARSRVLPVPSQEDKIRADEDRVLSDPQADENAKWRVQSNRVLRENQRVTAQALFQSTDMADRTAFDSLATSKPAVYTRYKDEVEKRLSQARSQGGNPSRQDILRWLIGQDAIDGKLGPKKKAAAAAPARPAVNRGSLPGARGDSPARGGTMSAREKLARKLENVQI